MPIKTSVTCRFYGKIEAISFKSIVPFENSDIILYNIYLPEYIDFIRYTSQYLNAQELDRAKRYYKEKDKNRFIICRIMLKFILAIHTQQHISKIKIGFHKNKKPFLPSHPSLFFNISHSGDYAIIAVAKRPIGVDIEKINPTYDFKELLPNIFNENEIKHIQTSIDKNRSFYDLWTRKEAFVKALGKGIDDDFPYITIMNDSHDLDIKITRLENTWKLLSFELNKEYMGAVAINILPGLNEKLKFYTLPKKLEDLLLLTSF